MTQVAPVIDSMAEIAPPGVDTAAWKEAVRETHAMLVTVLSANLLDIQQMQLLREELRKSVERARLHPGNGAFRIRKHLDCHGRPRRVRPPGRNVRQRKRTSGPRSCRRGRSRRRGRGPGRSLNPPLLEGIGKQFKLVHPQGLGAELAVDLQRLEQRLGLGLGPPVAPEV